MKILKKEISDLNSYINCKEAYKALAQLTESDFKRLVSLKPKNTTSKNTSNDSIPENDITKSNNIKSILKLLASMVTKTKREDIETRRERLQKSAAGQHYEVRPLPGPLPDLTVALPELDETVMNCLQAMEPFNSKNPYPVFHADDVCVSKLRELRGGHLQLELTQGRAAFSGIAFGMSDLKPKIRAQRMKIGVSFEPMWNLYNGRRSIQLLVKSVD